MSFITLITASFLRSSCFLFLLQARAFLLLSRIPESQVFFFFCRGIIKGTMGFFYAWPLLADVRTPVLSPLAGNRFAGSNF